MARAANQLTDMTYLFSIESVFHVEACYKSYTAMQILIVTAEEREKSKMFSNIQFDLWPPAIELIFQL